MASPMPRRGSPAPRIPDLIAHRGHTTRCPENTRSALQAAAACGASFVEVDVQLSADRVPVLFHDDTLDRLCGIGGAIHEHDWVSLSALRAGEPSRFGGRYADEPLASLGDLAELLRRHPGLTAFVEAKDVSILRFGNDTVLRAITDTLSQVAGQYVLISFAFEFLKLARTSTRQPLGAVIERWDDHGQAALRLLRPEYLFCDRNGLPAAGPLAIADDCRIAVYEVADGDEALALAARGVDMIETFAVCEMLRFMRRQATARRGDE